MDRWQASEPKEATVLGDRVQYSWGRCEHLGEEDHQHTIHCLWVWHDCAQILGPDSIAPGARFGWRAAGVSAHTLVQEYPLTITASVYWPGCCGLHGFITDGRWIGA